MTTKTTFRTVLGASGAALALLLTAACDSEEAAEETTSAEETTEEETTEEEATEDEATEEETTEEEATEEEATEEESDEEDGGSAAEGTTPAGTQLALGEAALVEYDYSGEPGMIEVTVTEIEQGDVADLEVLDLGDQAAGLAPWYIHLEVNGVDESSSVLEYASVGSDVRGLLPDGSRTPLFSVIGDFEPCNSEDLGADFGADSMVEVCVPALAPESLSVDQVQFAPSPGPYDLIDGEPLVWGD